MQRVIQDLSEPEAATIPNLRWGGGSYELGFSHLKVGLGLGWPGRPVSFL